MPIGFNSSISSHKPFIMDLMASFQAFTGIAKHVGRLAMGREIDAFRLDRDVIAIRRERFPSWRRRHSRQSFHRQAPEILRYPGSSVIKSFAA
jgi:hypothetical protein